MCGIMLCDYRLPYGSLCAHCHLKFTHKERAQGCSQLEGAKSGFEDCLTVPSLCLAGDHLYKALSIEHKEKAG